MSKHSTGAVGAMATLQDRLCRQIRISSERIRLSRDLEIAMRSRSDVRYAIPRGLEDLISYRRLAEEGLAHATVGYKDRSVVVLVALRRIWRRPALKRRLITVKRDAARIGRRVVIVTKRGLSRSGARSAG